MESATKYKQFNLIGNEFAFDVDLSQLPVRPLISVCYRIMNGLADL